MPSKPNAPSNKKVVPPRKPKSDALRFAHPYFTPKAPGERAEIPGHGQRMLDHIKGTLQPIPPVGGSGMMSLSNLIGPTGADANGARKQVTSKILRHTGVSGTQ